jgi:tetratricopeptide (TPR) repeat protein
MRLTGERLRLGRDGGSSNPWRLLVYVALIIGGIVLTRLVEAGRVKPLFLATPTPTRVATSFAQEAEAHFSAGNLNEAINAYQTAIAVDPDNAELLSELARIQTYSSDLLATLQERQLRLSEARDTVEQAIAANPDSWRANAIRALVYDWSAAAELEDKIGLEQEVRVVATLTEGGDLEARLIELSGGVPSTSTGSSGQDDPTVVFIGIVEVIRPDSWTVSGRTVGISSRTNIREQNRRDDFLAIADSSARRALNLDPGNPLALAYLAEVTVDQQGFAQALEWAQEAIQNVDDVPPKDQMDIHRIYATVLEHHAQYSWALQEYEEAIRLYPNLTFLYLYSGANYRQLRDIDRALKQFDKAAKINDQLGIQDPTPYLAIGKTYQQQGQFFIAAANIQRALAIDPTNPEIYARLGIVYFQARNYETAIEVFECAIDGCLPEQGSELLCNLGVFRCSEMDLIEQSLGSGVVGLELGSNSVEFYYTYGSVLAAFAGHVDYPFDETCERAELVFRELESKFGTDVIVSTIIAEGRVICSSSSPPAPISTPTLPLPNSS